MKNKASAVFLTLMVAIAGISLPLWFAFTESERQAYRAESARALAYAGDVVLRSDETGDQMAAGLARIAALPDDAPCGPASLDRMRQIDLSSRYLQAVGHVEGNQLRCSSIASAEQVFDLGPPDYRTSRGAIMRADVRFPFAPQTGFLVIQNGSFAAIIHKELAIDTAKSEPDVSLAVLSLERPMPVIVRGKVDPRWIGRLGGAREVAFAQDGQLVAVVRSDRYLIAGVAALPLAHVQARSDSLALRLVPAGLVAGVLLALGILHLGRQQMSLSAAVRTALRRKEFFVLYQPVIDLRNGCCVGAEALVRWRRTTGEVVGPELFVPIAEQNGLIVRLTREVLDLVGKEAGAWLAERPDFHVGVNVSPADFRAEGFLDSLDAVVRGMRARPANLLLEVTERGLLDPEVARQTSGALRRHGFLLAIDDFGTGYSSLSYLETLELDYLKIDRSFISAIGTAAPTSQVVGHIIRMAGDLGLRMIAEGVESQAQADYLRRQGVQYAQGWLFGRPMPFADLARLVEEAAAPPAGPLRATA